VSELYNTFHDHFEMVPANTLGLMETAFRIRYQVYCVERSFEDQDAFPNQMETDEYDLHSAQTLMRCKASGQYTGMVRLVLPNPVDPNTPCESLAEISRFSISKELRSQCSRKPVISVVGAENEQDDKKVDARMMPHIALGLFAGIVRMSAQNNITHWLSVMEPTFLRFLSRYGIYFQKTGPVVDYHGRRQPAVASIDSVLSGIHAHRKDVWEIITDHGNVWPLFKDAKHFVYS
jgi:N-acyl-L-homoserine lactone synthetase